ncbi:sugar ABC transporter permease [Streptomyces sp. NPDC086519]|uniref:carbohydrate ABC transporter permease n=1 Tax=Streptomyces sp. NPDC086519 TaxID=3154863 RepID=UPI00344A28F1
MTLLSDRTAASGRRNPASRRPGSRPWARRWVGLLFVLPALVPYAVFVLRPLVVSAQYSLYDWNGIGAARFVGFDNYRQVLTSSDQLTPILHAFELILFFTVIPVCLGLVTAALLHGLPNGPLAKTARVVLFVPQVIPLVAAALAWSWVYSSDGVLNQFLRTIGLGSWSRAWLGDFTWAFTAVGLIGSWVSLGLCTLLLITGINKIDPTLYDAARIDGAGPVQEFMAVTLPGLRREIGVCVTVTVIAALASFDIVYVTTQGGPGTQTLVPGLQIFQLAFTQRDVGLASATAIVLMALVLLVVTPLQRISRGAE